MFIRLLRKDFLLIARNLKTLISIYFFSLLLAFVFSFAFLSIGLQSEDRAALYPAILVVTTLFVSCLLFSQTVLVEREEGALLGLIYSGYSGVQLFLSKFIVNFTILTSVLFLFLLELKLFYFDLPQSISLNLLLLLIPLSLSISALGTLLSLIAVVSSSRELLFSILFFPLSLPTVGSVLHLFQESILGNSIQIDSFPMMVLLVSGLIYTTLGAILFEEAI